MGSIVIALSLGGDGESKVRKALIILYYELSIKNNKIKICCFFFFSGITIINDMEKILRPADGYKIRICNK